MSVSLYRVSTGGRSSSGNNSNTLPPVTNGQVTRKLKKLPDSTRGGGLRIGKVITDARAAITPGKDVDRPTYTLHTSALTGPTAANRFVDGEERRVQEEIIEMLTTRLAKKEKESELLRRQQTAFDAQSSRFEARVEDLEQELEATKADLTAKVEQLQRELQQSQLLTDRFRTEAESQRVAIQEGRRQRERDSELFRSKELQLERQADELRRELGFLKTEKRSLEDRFAAGRQQLHAVETQIRESESRGNELQALLTRTQEAVSELSLQLEASHTAMSRQENQHQLLEQEKQHLEDKVQQLSRSLREVNTRASDAERRKSELSQAETHLTKQLTQLHRDNEELKAHNSQLQAQTKQQQTRLTSLESTKAASDAKLKDAREEVDHAGKKLREHEFRLQQLQEEVKFLTKKKPTGVVQPMTNPRTPKPAKAIGNGVVSSRPVAEPADSTPSWMRD